MLHLTTWTELQSLSDRPLTLLIGNFDGLHRGHTALIERARALAEEKGSAVALMNFNPHPDAYFSGLPVARLTDDREFGAVLRGFGVSAWLQMPFDAETAGLEPATFLERILCGLDVKDIVVGFNFKFGKAASGNVGTLHELGSVYGYTAHIVDPVIVRSCAPQPISSTLIRSLVSDGKMEEASCALGRPYSVCGEVVRGYRRGMKLGFPTANISVPEGKLCPPPGVYAGRSGGYTAAINIGFNPTFGNREQSLEVHLIGYSGGDLYGEVLTVEFLRFLRPERRFDTVEALRCQLDADIAQIKALKAASDVYK